MKKRVRYLIFPLITLLLELLPYGAVCVFAPSPTERIRETFSYFDLTPFGYANFFPFITAMLTCVIFLLLAVYCFRGTVGTANKAKHLLLGTVIVSLGSLLFGISYYSPVGGLITLSLTAELLFLHVTLG